MLSPLFHHSLNVESHGSLLGHFLTPHLPGRLLQSHDFRCHFMLKALQAANLNQIFFISKYYKRPKLWLYVLKNKWFLFMEPQANIKSEISYMFLNHFLIFSHALGVSFVCLYSIEQLCVGRYCLTESKKSTEIRR